MLFVWYLTSKERNKVVHIINRNSIASSKVMSGEFQPCKKGYAVNKGVWNDQEILKWTKHIT